MTNLIRLPPTTTMAAQQITKTAIGNYLRKQPNGDIGMYRNGFKDGVAWAVKKLSAPAPQPAQDAPVEVDWQEQYWHQKRRAEMWIAKYEKDIGPLERIVPVALQSAQPIDTSPQRVDKTGNGGHDGEPALADFENLQVQAVYEILCDTETNTPEGEHWEGFIARRIVAALQSSQPPHECKTEAEKLAYAAGWWKALEVNKVVRLVSEHGIKEGK